MKISTSIAVFTLLVVSVPAASAADSPSWRVASSNDDGEVISISSGDDATNGALFSCVDNRLIVAVGVEAGDVHEMMSTLTRRSRDYIFKTSIGDGESFRSNWTYLPSNKVAVADKSTTARQFYNAAIRGDEIVITMSGKGDIAVTLPSVNDAFTSFANDCSVTNPDK